MFDNLSDLRTPDSEDDDSSLDDDLLEELTSDDELLADLSNDDELLADLSSLEETVVSPPFDFDDPTMPRFGDELPVDETATVAATARSGPERPFLGMTAQQRAVLALFLFLDVLVIGFLILLGTGAISIPVP